MKNRRGNLPPNPLALLGMFVFLIMISIRVSHDVSLYPQIPSLNLWDYIFYGIVGIALLICSINVLYSTYEALRYGGP